MLCRNCGRKIKANEQFCTYCGTKNSEKQQSTQRTNSQQTGVYIQDSLYGTQNSLYAQVDDDQEQTRPKRRKTILIALCCLWAVVSLSCIALLCVSLNSESPSDDPPYVEPPYVEPDDDDDDDEDDEEEIVPELPDELVSDAFYDNSKQNTYGGIFAIPQINLPSAEIQKVNEEIYQMMYTNLTENLLRNWDSEKNGNEQISYTWRQRDDTLSLTIEVHPVNWDWTEYYVYNISVSEQRQLTDDEVIDRSNINDYQGTAKKALESTFWESFSDEPRGTVEEAVYFNELLNKTRSDENIKAAHPFFDLQGKLSIVVPIYAFSGSEYYWEIVSLEGFSYKPEYSGEAPVPEEKPAPETNKGSDSEYIIPDSNTRLIDESDLYGLTKFECWVALDEIYARHGRLFGNADIVNHFNSTSWYYGYIPGEEFDKNLDFYLNATEKRNIETIVAYMKKMGWR